jgi:hypothetical protein
VITLVLRRWLVPPVSELSEACRQAGWLNMLGRYGWRWNLLGLDLLNQPHGRATWAEGNPSTDWNSAFEDTVYR